MKVPYRISRTALFLMGGDKPVYLPMLDVVQIQFQPDSCLHLRGMLPERRDLLEIEDGATFEIVFNQCGLVQYGQHTIPLFRFENCKVIERYIKNAVSCSEDQVLYADVVFTCDITIPEWEPRNADD
ncbi:MAG: hypothetical protein GY832_25935 [Chloroflexi bacterium]|nr:hypothetical protein [Chloroflexota bacterium]